MTKEDAKDIDEILNDFELNKYFGYYDLETGIQYSEFENSNLTYFENIAKEYEKGTEIRLVIELKSEKKVVGEVIIYDFIMNRQAEIGYRINRNYWGKGIATEALNAAVQFLFWEMGLKRIMLRCFTINEASGKVAEKVGFKLEGHIREGFIVKVFADHYVYGLLSKEYAPKP